MSTEKKETLNWVERAANKIAGLRVAHEAMMVSDAQQVLAAERDRVRAHQELMGIASGTPSSDEMIHVGDVHVTQNTPAAAPKAANSTLGKVALAAGLVGAGAVPGAVAAYMLTRPEPAQVQPAEPQQPAFDSDTRYGLGVSSTPGPPAD